MTSLLLFGLWAIPYMGQMDSMSASAAESLTLAPAHREMEVLIMDLAKAREAKENTSPAEEAVLGVFRSLLEEQNPQQHLLRGDGAYFLSLYAAAAQFPCADSQEAQEMCAQLPGNATHSPSLERLRTFLGHHPDVETFPDVEAELWYRPYVIFLQRLGAISTTLDARSLDIPVFDGAAPLYAADMYRWMAALDGMPARTVAPGKYITRYEAATMLSERLIQLWAARAARS